MLVLTKWVQILVQSLLSSWIIKTHSQTDTVFYRVPSHSQGPNYNCGIFVGFLLIALDCLKPPRKAIAQSS
jgi:hypothetical protein